MIHLKATIFILSFILLQDANGRPTRFANLQENDTKNEIMPNNTEKYDSNVPLMRLKRVSDQRLAELETLYALSKINLITTTNRPIYMKINAMAIGRRRRSANNSDVHETRRIDQRSSESTINEILIS